ncbi:hypothetical protein ACTNEN_09645 [Oribacterium sp. HCP28S3_H8]|uniref:hypothetical protein n=1 Tax=Oribacterium sp. HCP28S3_H8 TaxID=3438945 RepID=UPI003F8A8D0D
MAMNKYNDIEIQTAKNLLKGGYKWLVRETCGDLYVYKDKPHKNYDRDTSDDTWQYDGEYDQICTIQVSIFQNVTCVDKEPVSLENIVHPQILDDAEQRYLSAVIRPFRDNVKSISKCISYPSREFIAIYCKNGDKTLFPWFEAGIMYNGMERYKEYTVEELGL